MKILHIITGLGIGGAERVVLDLSEQYKKARHNVFVISLSNKNELEPFFHKIGIEPLIYDLSNPFRFIKIVKMIINFIRSNKISIVHLHLAHPVLLSPFIRIFTKAKIVFTSHSFDIGSKFRELYAWALKPFRHSDVLFSESQKTFFYKKRYEIIPNGVDLNKYDLDCEKNDIFTFIAVGRLEKVKNHIVLIDLINQLINKHNIICKLQIVGDGILKKDIKNKIAALGLNDNIELLGVRNDVNLLLNKAHCMLMPSLWEGLPIVLLEAAASKLPIISTNVGSIPTLLNTTNSYISELSYFEKNMLEVTCDYDFAMQKANLLFSKFVDKYSIDSVVDQHLLLYSSLLS